MPEILDILTNDHHNIARLVKIIEREMKAFEAGEHPDYELVQSVLNYLLTYPDLYHHPLEDAVVRRLKELTDEDAVPGAADLEREHQNLAKAIRRFLAALNNVLSDEMLPRDWFCDIAREFVTFQRKHMHMEEVVLFPAAKRSLSDADWAQIEAPRGSDKDPLFGPTPDAEFADLRTRLEEAS